MLRYLVCFNFCLFCVLYTWWFTRWWLCIHNSCSFYLTAFVFVICKMFLRNVVFLSVSHYLFYVVNQVCSHWFTLNTGVWADHVGWFSGKCVAVEEVFLGCNYFLCVCCLLYLSRVGIYEFPKPLWFSILFHKWWW